MLTKHPNFFAELSYYIATVTAGGAVPVPGARAAVVRAAGEAVLRHRLPRVPVRPGRAAGQAAVGQRPRRPGRRRPDPPGQAGRHPGRQLRPHARACWTTSRRRCRDRGDGGAQRVAAAQRPRGGPLGGRGRAPDGGRDRGGHAAARRRSGSTSSRTSGYLHEYARAIAFTVAATTEPRRAVHPGPVPRPDRRRRDPGQRGVPGPGWADRRHRWRRCCPRPTPTPGTCSTPPAAAAWPWPWPRCCPASGATARSASAWSRSLPADPIYAGLDRAVRRGRLRRAGGRVHGACSTSPALRATRRPPRPRSTARPVTRSPSGRWPTPSGESDRPL